MNLAGMWQFIAGDSRIAPLAVVVAIVVTVLLLHTAAPPVLAAVALPGLVALGLVASVFETR